MISQFEAKNGIKYIQTSIFYEHVQLPLIVWDNQKNFARTVRINTVIPIQEINQQTSYEINSTIENTTFLAVQIPVKLQKISDIANRFDLHDFKSTKATTAYTTLFKPITSDFLYDIPKILLTENQDFTILMCVHFENQTQYNKLIKDHIRSFLSDEVQWIGIAIQTMDLRDIQRILNVKIDRLAEQITYLTNANHSFMQNFTESKQINLQLQKPHYKTVQKEVKLLQELQSVQTFMEDISSYKLQEQKKQIETNRTQFDLRQKILSEKAKSEELEALIQGQFVVDMGSYTTISIFGLDKQQQNQLINLCSTNYFYTKAVADIKKKAVSFVQTQFTKSEIKRALKYLQQPHLIQQLMEEIILQKSLIILGPGIICNILARTIALLLPNSEKQQILYYKDGHNFSGCQDCEGIEAQLYQIRFQQSLPSENDYTIDKFEQNDVQFDYFRSNQELQIGNYPCSGVQHFQPLYNCKIQVVNGSLQSLDIDQLVRLENKPQIINLMAENQEEVIMDYNYLKTEWNILSKFIQQLKLCNSTQSLHLIYNKLFFATFKLGNERSIIMNQNYLDGNYILIQKMCAQVKEQFIASSVLSAKQQQFYLQQSIKLKGLDIFFSSIQNILSVNFQNMVFDWTFYDMIQSPARISRILREMFESNWLPCYSSASLVIVEQSLKYEIGV